MEGLDRYLIDHDLEDTTGRPIPNVSWMKPSLHSIPHPHPGLNPRQQQQQHGSRIQHIDFQDPLTIRRETPDLSWLNPANENTTRQPTNVPTFGAPPPPSFLQNANRPIPSNARDSLRPAALSRPSVQPAYTHPFLGAPSSALGAINRPGIPRPARNVVEQSDVRDFGPAYRGQINQPPRPAIGLSERPAYESMHCPNGAAGIGPFPLGNMMAVVGPDRNVHEPPAASKAPWPRQESVTQPPTHSMFKEPIRKSGFGPPKKLSAIRPANNPAIHAEPPKKACDLLKTAPLQPIRAAAPLNNSFCKPAPVVDVSAFGRPGNDVSAFGRPKTSAYKPLPGISHSTSLKEGNSEPEKCMNVASIKTNNEPHSAAGGDISNGSSRPSSPFEDLYLQAYGMLKTSPNGAKAKPVYETTTRCHTSPPTAPTLVSKSDNPVEMTRASEPAPAYDPVRMPTSVMDTRKRPSTPSPDSSFHQLSYETSDDSVYEQVVEKEIHIPNGQTSDKSLDERAYTPVDGPIPHESKTKPVFQNTAHASSYTFADAKTAFESACRIADEKTALKSEHIPADEKTALKSEHVPVDQKTAYESTYKLADVKTAYEAIYKHVDEKNAHESTCNTADVKAATEAAYKPIDEKTAYESDKKPANEKTAYESAYTQVEEETINESAYKLAEERDAFKSAYKPSDEKTAYESAYKNVDEKTAYESANKTADDKAAYETALKLADEKTVYESACEAKNEKAAYETAYESAFELSSQGPSYAKAPDILAHERPREPPSGQYNLRPSNKPASETAIHEIQQRQANASRSRKSKYDSSRSPHLSPQQSPRQTIRASASAIDSGTSHMSAADSKKLEPEHTQPTPGQDGAEIVPPVVVPNQTMGTDDRHSRSDGRQQRPIPGRRRVCNSADRRHAKKHRHGKSQTSPVDSLASDFNNEYIDDSRGDVSRSETHAGDTGDVDESVTKATNVHANTDSRPKHRVRFAIDSVQADNLKHGKGPMSPVESLSSDSQMNKSISDESAGEISNAGLSIPKPKTTPTDIRPVRRVRFTIDTGQDDTHRHGKSPMSPDNTLSSEKNGSIPDLNAARNTACADVHVDDEPMSLVESSSIASDFRSGRIADAQLNGFIFEPHATRETAGIDMPVVNPDPLPQSIVTRIRQAITDQVSSTSNDREQVDIHRHGLNQPSPVESAVSGINTDFTEVTQVNISKAEAAATTIDESAIKDIAMDTGSRHPKRVVKRPQDISEQRVDSSVDRMQGNKLRYAKTPVESPSSGRTSTEYNSTISSSTFETATRHPTIHHTTININDDSKPSIMINCNTAASDAHVSNATQDPHKTNGNIVILKDEPNESHIKKRKKRTRTSVCNDPQTTIEELHKEDILQMIYDQLDKLGIVVPRSIASPQKHDPPPEVSHGPFYHSKLPCGIKKSELLMKIDAIARKNVRDLLQRWPGDDATAHLMKSYNGDGMLPPDHNITHDGHRKVKKKKNVDSMVHIEELIRNILCAYISQLPANTRRDNKGDGAYGDGEPPRPRCDHMEERQRQTKTSGYMINGNGNDRSGPFVPVSSDDDDDEYDELYQHEHARHMANQGRRMMGRRQLQNTTCTQIYKKSMPLIHDSYTGVDRRTAEYQMRTGVNNTNQTNASMTWSNTVGNVSTQTSEKASTMPTSMSYSEIGEYAQTSEKENTMSNSWSSSIPDVSGWASEEGHSVSNSRSVSITNVSEQTSDKARQMSMSEYNPVTNECIQTSSEKVNRWITSLSNCVTDGSTQTSEKACNVSKSRTKRVAHGCTQTSENMGIMPKPHSNVYVPVVSGCTQTSGKMGIMPKSRSNVSVASGCTQTSGKMGIMPKSRSNVSVASGCTQTSGEMGIMPKSRSNVSVVSGCTHTSQKVSKMPKSCSNVSVTSGCTQTSEKMNNISRSRFHSVANGCTQTSEKSSSMSMSRTASLASGYTQTSEKMDKVSKSRSISVRHMGTQADEKTNKSLSTCVTNVGTQTRRETGKSDLKGRQPSRHKKTHEDIHRKSSCIYQTSGSDTDTDKCDVSIDYNRTIEDSESCSVANLSTQTNKKKNPVVSEPKSTPVVREPKSKPVKCEPKSKPVVCESNSKTVVGPKTCDKISPAPLKNGTRSETRKQSSCMYQTSDSESTLGDSYDYNKHGEHKKSCSNSMINVSNQSNDNVKPAVVEPANRVSIDTTPPKKEARVKKRKQSSCMYPTSSSESGSADEAGDKNKASKGKATPTDNSEAQDHTFEQTDYNRDLEHRATPMNNNRAVDTKDSHSYTRDHKHGDNQSNRKGSIDNDNRSYKRNSEDKDNQRKSSDLEDEDAHSNVAKIHLDPNALKMFIEADEYDDEDNFIRPGVWRCDFGFDPASFVNTGDGQNDLCEDYSGDYMSADYDDDTVDSINSNEIYQGEAVPAKPALFSGIKKRFRNIFKNK